MTLSNVGKGYLIGDGLPSDVLMFAQDTPATASTSATLTADQVATGLIRVDQAAAGATTLTLPTGALMDARISNAVAGFAFLLRINNIGDNSAEDATIAAGTGWTLYGNMVVAANSGATEISAGTFLARKTGDATWTLDRVG